MSADLFHGIAVVIDDDRASIDPVIRQIEAEGCHVVYFGDIPAGDRIKTLRGASFFILDWKLYEETVLLEDGSRVPVPDTLRRQKTQDSIDFLKTLRAVRFAPVFIFSTEPTAEIEEALRQHPDLWDDQDPSHILVKTKSEVESEGLFFVLSSWLTAAPSAYVLKEWERTYETAKNAFFLDFYLKSPYWPLFLWKDFEADGVVPGIGLRSLIASNLSSRMSEPTLDLTNYLPALEELSARVGPYKAAVTGVLEAERFLQYNCTSPQMLNLGDVFKRGGNYYINVRPECDCIARNGNQDCVELYLLKGSKLTPTQFEAAFKADHGAFSDLDSEATIFPIAGHAIKFQFKRLVIGTWAEWKDCRKGRLLPPFSTRIQQKYASYLQRPGLPRLPAFLGQSTASAPNEAVPRPPMQSAPPGDSQSLATPSARCEEISNA